MRKSRYARIYERVINIEIFIKYAGIPNYFDGLIANIAESIMAEESLIHNGRIS